MKDYRKLLILKNSPLITFLKLVIFPTFLFLLFLLVYDMHVSLQKEITKYDLSSFTETAPVASYPFLTNPYTPYISAQSAVVMDDASKVFIYQKNPQIRFAMASTTKLMTALVALEQFSLNDPLIVYPEGVEGSVIGLRKGEQYTLDSLLYAMMLPSANDAAETIASNYPGGRQAFITRMNKKAEELLLTDTHYDDPAGLGDDANYTTAYDLANLASIALKNETIARITATKQKLISDTTGSHVIPLENLNILLGINGVIGLKTGYTQGAGGVLATARKVDGRTQIIVVMRSLDRFADTSTLLALITGNVTYFTPDYSPMSLTGLKVIQ